MKKVSDSSKKGKDQGNDKKPAKAPGKGGVALKGDADELNHDALGKIAGGTQSRTKPKPDQY